MKRIIVEMYEYVYAQYITESYIILRCREWVKIRRYNSIHGKLK